MKTTFFTFCLIVFFVHSGFSQTEEEKVNQSVIITLMDKSEITGELISENDQEIVIESNSLGLLTFQRAEIRKIIYLNADGKLPNPNPTRYFIGQSAYNLEKGEGYYQNIYGLVNLVSFGITDRFSVLAGTEIISLFNGAPILLTNLKYGFPIAKNLRAAASFTYITSGGEFAGDLNLGSLNALLTYGNTEHNVTLGTGYALANGEINNTSILTIGGMTRLTNRLAFVSENYVLMGENDALLSGGVRYIAKKLTVDLLIFQGGFPAIDIVLKF
ncbi:hypothetical protein [Roseivirga misakiensis]|uniref:Uncharacterized protein n=1 Tax=Roseivirga misakiensis TaxID=1563681 RepID=A0A1E5T309_9BACT|nr:hypothetical protein [Roseivirga misakiensis]OEK05773.1 hypothetical protein BFP71_06530 [Roseivirga misakiensis]